MKEEKKAKIQIEIMSYERKNLLNVLSKSDSFEAEKLINTYAKTKNISVPKFLVTPYTRDIKSFGLKNYAPHIF